EKLEAVLERVIFHQDITQHTMTRAVKSISIYSIGTYSQEEVTGAFKLINHGKDITAEVKESVVVELTVDGNITGAVTISFNDYPMKKRLALVAGGRRFLWCESTCSRSTSINNLLTTELPVHSPPIRRSPTKS